MTKGRLDFIADTRASVATLFAVLLPLMLGFAAAGIETGFWFSERQRLQMASDTAAYSALVSYAASAGVQDAAARGVTEARASGFDGAASNIAVTVYPASGNRVAYATATIRDTAPLFLTRLFIKEQLVPVTAKSFASLQAASVNNCLMTLDESASRAILFAASVKVTLQKCRASSNSTPNDFIWLEGTAWLKTDCISTPGGVSWNGGAMLTMNSCTTGNFPKVKQTNPYAATPFWGDPGVTSPSHFADAAISQGRYGPGMPGGATLMPGKYGKQVEIAGPVTLMPGVYYFTNGFRATNGGRISGAGVTLYFDQTKTMDVAQSVAWRITAPTSGATRGVALMGDPKKTAAGNVRLIGIMGNVEGLVYFPNQKLLTESGPNTSPALCTTIVAKTLDIRGSGTIDNDCTTSPGNSAGGNNKVKLVKRAPA